MSLQNMSLSKVGMFIWLSVSEIQTSEKCVRRRMMLQLSSFLSLCSLRLFDSRYLFLSLTLHSLCRLQYQAWWKDRYGKNSLSDDEEVETLLTKKSNSSSSITTQVAPEKNILCQSRLSWTQAAEHCGLRPGPLNPLRPDRPSLWMLQRKAAAGTHEMLNLMFAGADMWWEGVFMSWSQSPHAMSLPLTVKTTCKGGQACHQGNMYTQSHSVNTHLAASTPHQLRYAVSSTWNMSITFYRRCGSYGDVQKQYL